MATTEQIQRILNQFGATNVGAFKGCSIDELYSSLSNQIVELKLEHEQEKTHLFQQHNAEKDCLVRDHEREIEKAGEAESRCHGRAREQNSGVQEARRAGNDQ